MATAQIEVISLNGELFLVRDGNLEPISEGQVLEVIADQANLLVGEGSNAVVMVNGDEFELGANASLDIPLGDEPAGDATEQSLADGSIDDLLQALESDQDLLELVEAPAAGAEGGEGGRGEGGGLDLDRPGRGKPAGALSAVGHGPREQVGADFGDSHPRH